MAEVMHRLDKVWWQKNKKDKNNLVPWSVLPNMFYKHVSADASAMFSVNWNLVVKLKSVVFSNVFHHCYYPDILQISNIQCTYCI